MNLYGIPVFWPCAYRYWNTHFPKTISVVLANREYEAWFIAAAESLQGIRGFIYDPAKVVEPERPRDAKSWIKACMANCSYGETTDQPAFFRADRLAASVRP
ncbi:MAG: hypothetical protein PHH11_17230 [Methylomonas sp.]|nr:hypothetical protein [Methylomonas sp.]